ncbi:MAG: class I SAM-dependent methyltransferase, partial [Nanoarchaeota archaeon]|nr:class I SAM-dependent methyltransferase [Nanoarchaeota archaeon]
MKSNNEQIIKYYDSCEIDFKLLWHLNKNYAFHYGYWDEKVKNFDQSLLRFNEIIIEKAKIKKTDRILDAGCGIGGTSIFIAKKIGCKIEGITISQNQVDKAKKLAKKLNVSSLINFSNQDYMNTKFKSGSFDVIFALESVCYSDKKKFLREAYSLLKKGGRLIVADFFNSKSDFSDKEKKLINKWLNGWAVDSLETSLFFETKSNEIGFKNIKYKKITDKIMNSSKRL